MQVYHFLVLAGLALPAVTALDHQYGHRDIGKGITPVSEEPSTTDSASSVSTVSQGWGGYSDTCYYPGVTRSSYTTTVTIAMSPPPPPPPPPAPASASSDTSVSFPEISVTTTVFVSTTSFPTRIATTVTITASPNFSDASLPPSPSIVESSQSEDDPYTSLDEPSSETALPVSSAAPTLTDSSLDSAQPTASASDSAFPSLSAASSSTSFMNSSLSSAEPTASGRSSSLPSSTPTDNCPKEPFNKTDMPVYFGFNVVNTKPRADLTQPTQFRTTDDWDAAFTLLKQNFPQINAVRMYSTTDGSARHLMNAMPAARNHNLSILVGVWSTTPNITDFSRFDLEKDALEDVFQKHGCDNIAAISVGNEDLNTINLNHQGALEDKINGDKQTVAENLVNQISQIRNMTRYYKCCNIPITHTDTWNEFSNISNSWVSQLISAVDQATIVNIFPYWSQAQVTNSWQMIANQSDHTARITTAFGKDVWLGETGWASWQPADFGAYNEYGTSSADAQQYFHQVGCEILKGTGTGFYYVDWDGDAKIHDNPTFGLFDSFGKPLQDIDCSGFKYDMRMKDYPNLPAFMGINQVKE